MIAPTEDTPARVGGGSAEIVVQGFRSGATPPRDAEGRLQLQSERRWVIEGSRAKLAQIEAVLPVSAWNRVGRGALVLSLVNSVGTLELPHVGPVELYSGKLNRRDFEALLADVTALATSLPFSARDPGSAQYDSGAAPPDQVLYHAFVYLRYILSEDAPADTRLIPALELIQRTPYRRWRTERREVRIEALTRVDSHTLLDLVTRTGTPVQAASLSVPGRHSPRALGGQLPETVSERRIRATIDTPENRFVKAFIGQAQGIIGRTRAAVEGGAQRVREESDRRLRPAGRGADAHRTPFDVGRSREDGTDPVSSTVLQRRRGYRHVLRHFARIRLAPRIPLDSRELRNLLELKDIATLYELWTFFRLADLVRALLGPPIRSARPARSDSFQVSLGWNQTFEWASGVRLAYNRTFSPSRDSYSVRLRPDIALYLPGRSNADLHLFDAKFSVRRTLRRGARYGEGGRAAGRRRGAKGRVHARRPLQDAHLPGRDSERPLRVDPVPRHGVPFL